MKVLFPHLEKALNEHVMYNITEIFTFQIKEVMKHFVRIFTTIMTFLFFLYFIKCKSNIQVTPIVLFNMF